MVTTDNNYLFPEDDGLLPQLPPEVVVIRARYVEPTRRGLRMLAGGEARTTETLRSAKNGADRDAPLSAAKQGAVGSFGRKACQHLLSAWVQVPDWYNTWIRPAIAACEQAVVDYGVRLIWTTTTPFSCAQIGLAMKQRGLRCISDFRDPLP